MLLRVLVALSLSVFAVSCGSSADKPANNQTPTPSTAKAKAQGSTTTVAPIAEFQSCPKYRAAVNAGTVTDAQLNELSGLAMSVRNPGVMWTHNDSGDSARIFALTKTGKLLSIVTLDKTTVFDSEDIAVSHNGPSEVWLADIGDNFRFRPNVDLYHFPEPDATQSTTVTPRHVTVKYERPDGTDTYSIDAESFFLDSTGNGYIIEKPKDQKLAWVFQITAADLQKDSATAHPIVQITGNTSGVGVGPTAADLSADGTTLAIKNYSETFIWRFSARSSIPTVLAQRPTAKCVVAAGLGEAITFDGADLLTTEEGVGKPIRRTVSIQ